MYRVDSSVQERFYAPRDLCALIDLYESNYVRLRQLVPDVEALEGTRISQVEGALALYVTVLERFKYTTTINLTYCFHDRDGVQMFEPNARVCLYHDVRAAEMISHCRRRRSRQVSPWRRGRMPEVDRKWEMNRFLLKWLKFCTHQGHLFLSGTSAHADEIGALIHAEIRAASQAAAD